MPLRTPLAALVFPPLELVNLDPDVVHDLIAHPT
jgi:hypothetical protein